MNWCEFSQYMYNAGSKRGEHGYAHILSDTALTYIAARYSGHTYKAEKLVCRCIQLLSLEYAYAGVSIYMQWSVQLTHGPDNCTFSHIFSFILYVVYVLPLSC